MSTNALLGIGQVRHTRYRPVRHAFAYPALFLMLPMRALRSRPDASLPRNRWGPISFHDVDHGDGGSDALAWFEALLARAGIDDADGEVWLHCLPRMWGYAFKPVSFWYAHRHDGSLAAFVAEVNNTFGERHLYVFAGQPLRWGMELRADKAFHVSPFCSTTGQYRFRFHRTADRTVVRVEHEDEAGPVLLTSVSGHLQPATESSLRRAACRMPLHTFGVVTRIHLQALRLWWRGVPVFSKPAPPDKVVSFISPHAGA